jgi:hypothetical protein
MLVIHDDDAFRGDCAFRHPECRRNRAIGEQSFSTAQRYRKYLQPERIDQIMLEERLNEICASINVQIRPYLILFNSGFV